MKPILIVLSVFFFLFAFNTSVQAAEDTSVKTLENLMTAYNGESNAAHRYEAFAKKADEEGYGQVASLFRAAAAAEKVHIENHAKVIRSMGGMPKAEIESPEVKTTRENLEAALKGETYEKDVMYPEFIAQAKAASNKPAIRSFSLAKVVEAEHAKLYQDALNRLESMKGSGKVYYVCLVCGNTVPDAPPAECPICDAPKGKFIEVK